MAVSTFHESTLAYFTETTAGQPPGYTVSLPYGTAAGWATADTAGTAERVRHHEADPSFLIKGQIVDDTMSDRIFGKNAPLEGLSNVSGGALVLGVTGSEAVTTATNQVAETELMELLHHALGGQLLGYSTTVDVTVVSDVSYDVVAATGMEVGMLVAIEDATATGKLYPQRMLTLATKSATFSKAPNFTVAAADIVNAVCTTYVDTDNLDPDGGSYSTLSLYYQKGDHSWVAVGCKLQLDSISFARNEQPKFNFTVFAANSFAPDANSYTPVWTGTVQGTAGRAMGLDTVLRISADGVTTYACIDMDSANITVGVPVVPLETVTECNVAMPGIKGYVTEPADTIIEAQVFLTTGFEDAFQAKTAYNVSIECQADAGNSWCFMFPNCYFEPPTYAQNQASNMHALKFIAHEDTLTTTDLTRSKILIGQY